LGDMVLKISLATTQPKRKQQKPCLRIVLPDGISATLDKPPIIKRPPTENAQATLVREAKEKAADRLCCRVEFLVPSRETDRVILLVVLMNTDGEPIFGGRENCDRIRRFFDAEVGILPQPLSDAFDCRPTHDALCHLTRTRSAAAGGVACGPE